MAMRSLFALTAIALLSACVGPPKGARPGSRPVAVQPTGDLKQCAARLERQGARFALLPDKSFGGGCTATGSVRLIAASVPVTNVTAIRCPLASTLTDWIQRSVTPAARSAFGSPLARVETMGAYSCRNIVGGRGTGLSEHASANAVDVSAFVLADGRRVSVKAGWNGNGDEQRFLRAIRKSACQQFQTVLSPDYNAAHHDHFHFDMGRGPYCR